MSGRPRVVVTGFGVICSIGDDVASVSRSLREGAAGIRALRRYADETFPTSLAAEVNSSKADSLDSRRARRLSRSDRLAVVAAAEAIEMAGGSASLPLTGTLVSSGTSTGGLGEGEDYYLERSRSGAGSGSVSRVLQQPTSGPSDAVAGWFGFGGGVISNATACASAAAAIGAAADMLRDRFADAAVAGGTDALCRLTYSGFNVLQAVDSEPCRPFDSSRAGITLGEGAGYLVLEREEDALRRGVKPLVELAGWGSSCDAHHPTAPAEDGRGAEQAMRGALADAGIDAQAIDYVNAHGTGTPLNDSAESLAIGRVASPGTPVSSTKSFFGHTLGASGGIEAVVSILAILEDHVPATLRLESPLGEGKGIDFLPDQGRSMRVRTVLSNSFGFGGSNVSLVFRALGAEET